MYLHRELENAMNTSPLKLDSFKQLSNKAFDAAISDLFRNALRYTLIVENGEDTQDFHKKWSRMFKKI